MITQKQKQPEAAQHSRNRQCDHDAQGDRHGSALFPGKKFDLFLHRSTPFST